MVGVPPLLGRIALWLLRVALWLLWCVAHLGLLLHLWLGVALGLLLGRVSTQSLLGGVELRSHADAVLVVDLMRDLFVI